MGGRGRALGADDRRRGRDSTRRRGTCRGPRRLTRADPDWSLAEHVGHIADWQELAVGLHGPCRGDRGVWPLERATTTTANFDTLQRAPPRAVGVAPPRRDPQAPRGRPGRRLLARRPGACRLRSSATELGLALGLRDTARSLPGSSCRSSSRGPRNCAAVPSARQRIPPDADRRRRPPRPNLTIEAIVAVDTPREFRLHPRDRRGRLHRRGRPAPASSSRLSLRGGYPTQLTASEKPVSDPQWSPDGRRLAFVRDDEIWVIEADGSRVTWSSASPAGAGTRAGRPTVTGSRSCRDGAAGRRSG